MFVSQNTLNEDLSQRVKLLDRVDAHVGSHESRLAALSFFTHDCATTACMLFTAAIRFAVQRWLHVAPEQLNSSTSTGDLHRLNLFIALKEQITKFLFQRKLTVLS